jgi:hypothetical protein
MDFQIDEAYLTDVVVRTEYPRYNDRTDLTAEELISVIKNPAPAVSIGTKDHPEFTCLREQLEQDGYIQVQPGWWNGDCVLKPFRLNDVRFKKGDQFPCAAAMKFHLEFQKKCQQRKKGGHYA